MSEIQEPSPPAQVIAADWLIPMDGSDPPRVIRGGGVRVDGRGIIAAVGPADELAQPGDRREFFESAVLTPGLINAHAHLDMSYWAGHRDCLAGKCLPDWVVPIAAERMIRPPGEVAAAAAAGAIQSLAGGVTTVVDVTPASIAWREVLAAVAAVPIRRLALAEVLGFGPRARQFWGDVERIMEDLFTFGVVVDAAPRGDRSSPIGSPNEDKPWFGLSPHAPYSTCAAIYRRCVDAANANGLPLMTHLSESQEEVEFCRAGTGPWRRRVEQLGGAENVSEGEHVFTFGASGPITAPNASEKSEGSSATGFRMEIPHCSPVEYARRLGLLSHAPTLLAHVNYLEPGDLELLAAAAGRASVAYCPRTADFFGHRNHPWRRLLAGGVNVTIGTDSLASAPDLSMLAELRFLHEHHPDVAVGALFAMATRNAAAAIGQPGWIGQIVPGAYADLVAWRMENPSGSADQILTNLVEFPARPLAVFVGGRHDDGPALASVKSN